MARRLFNFVAAVSLFLWLATTAFRALLPTGGFVVTRYGANDARLLRAGWPGNPDVLQYQSLHDLAGGVVPLLDGSSRTSPLTFVQENHIGGGQFFRRAGVIAWWGRFRHTNGSFDFFVVTVDLSLVQLLASILPILWLIVWTVRRRLVQRRVAGGFCRACSYDLTGNTSGVCPECGMPVHRGVGILRTQTEEPVGRNDGSAN